MFSMLFSESGSIQPALVCLNCNEIMDSDTSMDVTDAANRDLELDIVVGCSNEYG